MPPDPAAKERRRFRGALKVVHRHRVEDRLSRRVSELVFVGGKPFAVVRWIDIGGVRTPLYTCALDPAKLRAEARNRFAYDGVTVDPRFDEPPEEPAAAGRLSAP